MVAICCSLKNHQPYNSVCTDCTPDCDLRLLRSARKPYALHGDFPNPNLLFWLFMLVFRVTHASSEESIFSFLPALNLSKIWASQSGENTHSSVLEYCAMLICKWYSCFRKACCLLFQGPRKVDILGSLEVAISSEMLENIFHSSISKKTWKTYWINFAKFFRWSIYHCCTQHCWHRLRITKLSVTCAMIYTL